ncbi:MAG: cyclophilin-like fold protein [Acutalibacteraceae bacterium]|nr:cyclophilin-like fold protein [Acutalibacteraceae bacterium]
MRTQDIAEALSPTATLVIEASGHTFYASFENSSSADALKQKLSSGEIELELHDYGSFEKVGSLPWDLPRNDEQVTTVPGDVILYQGNQITIYYDKNTWAFTRLVKINNTTKEELLEVLGYGNVKVKLSIEWSE